MSMIRYRFAMVALISCTIAGCGERDLSQTPQYVGVIGAEYRTKTELYAVGVYQDLVRKELGFISILPVQQTGPEIAFLRKVPAGHVFRVVGVRKRFSLVDDGTQFVVALDGLDLPPAVEVLLSLCCYYHSTDGFPDPTRFERVK